jgi:hypothetical protein
MQATSQRATLAHMRETIFISNTLRKFALAVATVAVSAQRSDASDPAP